VAVLAALTPTSAHADLCTAPPNDAYVAPIDLSGSGSQPGTVHCATQEAGEPNQGVERGSVWYSYTSNAANPVRVQLSMPYSPGTASVFSDAGSAAGLGAALNTGSQALTGKSSFQAEPETIYRIQVVGDAFSGQGFTLGYEILQKPVNDNLASAQDLGAGAGGNQSVALYGPTKEVGETPPGIGATTWYSWTAPATQRTTFFIEPYSSDFSYALAVYAGAATTPLASLAPVGGTRCGGVLETYQFDAVQGTSYVIALDSLLGDGVANDAFVLAWAPSPLNDSFAQATVVSGQQVSFGTVTNYAACAEAGEPLAARGSTVWYRWTAPSSGVLELVTTQSNQWEPVLAVFSGSTLGTLTPLANQPGLPVVADEASFRGFVTAGTEYRIQLAGLLNSLTTTPSMGQSKLDLIRRPGNDAFAEARSLAGPSGAGTVTENTTTASAEAGEAALPSRGGGSVWYTWTATVGGNFTIDTAGSAFDTLLAVYKGSTLPGLSLVASNDDSAYTLQSALSFPAVAGVVYRIAVTGFEQARGALTLHWRSPAAALTAAVSKASVVHPGGLTVTGVLRSLDTGAAIGGAPVKLQQMVYGATTWSNLTTATSSSTGAVSFTRAPTTRTSYRLVFAGTATYSAVISATKVVTVAPSVTAALAKTTTPLGGTVSLTGSVAPTHAGQRVSLQELVSGTWRAVTTAVLSGASGYTFAVRPTTRGTHVYRVVKPADADHVVGTSPSRSLSVT
jgi:hypothetical protein